MKKIPYPGASSFSQQSPHCVFSGDDLINFPQKEIIANQGDEVHFICQVTVPEHLKKDQLRIKWKHNGIYIHPHDKPDKYRLDKYRLDRKGQTLVIKRVKADDAGVYACIVNIDMDRDIASGRLEVRSKFISGSNILFHHVH